MKDELHPVEIFGPEAYIFLGGGREARWGAKDFYCTTRVTSIIQQMQMVKRFVKSSKVKELLEPTTLMTLSKPSYK